ncbi:MAG TPA: hypothetical protein P5048_01640 [Chlamydiales bacterium]|nr:hypothetical protein [Chlamydiales bacterium]
MSHDSKPIVLSIPKTFYFLWICLIIALCISFIPSICYLKKINYQMKKQIQATYKTAGIDPKKVMN